MTIELDLPPGLEDALRTQASRHGQSTGKYVLEMVKRQLVLIELGTFHRQDAPMSVADLKPRVPTPTGTTWLEAVRGHWPGDETDEEVERALEAMS